MIVQTQDVDFYQLTFQKVQNTHFSIELNPYKYIIGFGLKNEFSCFVN